MRSVYRIAGCLAAALALLAAGGCPTNGGSGSGVNASIGISSTRGAPPLRVSVSASGSTSSNGAITSTVWDFAGEATANTSDAAHTFTKPGKYPISLTVEDETGAIDVDRVTVQVQGPSASAVIVASPTSGTAPLSVQFDGTSSTAVDDAIESYLWDFGDLTTSRDDNPRHTYRATGTFTVTLRVVSFGGVEDTATATITVDTGSSTGSLQFNGSQFATLPASAASAQNFTFETWIKPQAEGGTVVSFGNPLVLLEIVPANNLLRLRVGAEVFEATVVNMAGRWSYVAIAYDATTGLSVSIDGIVGLTTPTSSSISISQLQLGSAFRGNIGLTRFWSTTRTTAQIASDATANLTGSETGLLGDWRMSDGSGQTLRNRATAGDDGVLGATSAVEATDPAWSSDTP